MSSLVKLTRPQKRRLKRLVQRSVEARPVRRAQVVLQLGSGVSVTQISDALSVARSTIYRWAAQFATLGEACLSACHSGRPAYTVDETLRETLVELVGQPPSDYGYLRNLDQRDAGWDLGLTARTSRPCFDGAPRTPEAGVTLPSRSSNAVHCPPVLQATKAGD